LINPYAPPKASDTNAASPQAWWKRAALWLGVLEIVVGVGVILGGCGYSLTIDFGVPFAAAAYAFVIGNVVLILPGVLLVRNTRHGWLAQILPLGFAILIAIAAMPDRPSGPPWMSE
jgi:hypothetical protein